MAPADYEQLGPELSAYLDGELDDQARAEIERRLAASPEARALLEELRAAAAAVRALPAAHAPVDLAVQLRRQSERELLLGPSRTPWYARAYLRTTGLAAAIVLVALASWRILQTAPPQTAAAPHGQVATRSPVPAQRPAPGDEAALETLGYAAAPANPLSSKLAAAPPPGDPASPAPAGRFAGGGGRFGGTSRVAEELRPERSGGAPAAGSELFDAATMSAAAEFEPGTEDASAAPPEAESPVAAALRQIQTLQATVDADAAHELEEDGLAAAPADVELVVTPRDERERRAIGRDVLRWRRDIGAGLGDGAVLADPAEVRALVRMLADRGVPTAVRTELDLMAFAALLEEDAATAAAPVPDDTPPGGLLADLGRMVGRRDADEPPSRERGTRTAEPARRQPAESAPVSLGVPLQTVDPAPAGTPEQGDEGDAGARPQGDPPADERAATPATTQPAEGSDNLLLGALRDAAVAAGVDLTGLPAAGGETAAPATQPVRLRLLVRIAE